MRPSRMGVFRALTAGEKKAKIGKILVYVGKRTPAVLNRFSPQDFMCMSLILKDIFYLPQKCPALFYLSPFDSPSFRPRAVSLYHCWYKKRSVRAAVPPTTMIANEIMFCAVLLNARKVTSG